MNFSTIVIKKENKPLNASTEISRRPKIIRRVLIFAAILFVAVLLAIRISANFQTPAILEEAPVNVKVSRAETMSIYATAPLSGRVQPIEEATVAPLASGEITRVNVKVGDRVNRGAVLFEIRDLSREQTTAAYNQALEARNAAQTAYERLAILYDEGAVSLQMMEQAQTAYAQAQESLTIAGATRDIARNNSVVTAPISGYVTYLSVSVGSVAAPGVPAVIVADVSRLEISTSASEYIVGKLKVGDPVDIHIATLGDAPYDGAIKAISPAPAAGGLTYPVTVSVEDASGEVMAGMFAEIRIISDEKDEVLCVPSDAVIVKSGRPVVVVIDGDNIAAFREVTPGIDNGEFVEIVSGLSANEIIAVSGQQYAKEGHAVNIIE